MGYNDTMSVMDLVAKEEVRQSECVSLIPSENYCSDAVMRAVGSVFGNKYSEGYPMKRYYEGNEVVDELELYVQDLAKKLFGVPFVNVQPYSGSPANSAVQMALLGDGDVMCGLKLSDGGHLTHGHPRITFSGRFFKSVQYGVGDDGRVDFGELREIVLRYKPKVIMAGTTAYPWLLDWERFREIADLVDAYLVADISHIAGLVVGGVHPSPVEWVDVITTTTHKTLRGPRGAMIMVTDRGLDKDSDLAKKIDRAVFPGLQGGPHNNVIAGIGVALEEAMRDDFKEYARNVVVNASTLANALRDKGISVVGTENHLLLMDFGEWVGGYQVSRAMAVAGLVANKNTIPRDVGTPIYPSGVRIGTPAVTTLGMGENEMVEIADMISVVVGVVRDWKLPDDKGDRVEFVRKFNEFITNNDELKSVRDRVVKLMVEYRS